MNEEGTILIFIKQEKFQYSPSREKVTAVTSTGSSLQFPYLLAPSHKEIVMKVLDESGQQFSVQGTASFIATVTDRKAVFEELRKTSDDVFAVFSDVTKVRGHTKTTFVARKIRLTDEKSFDDMVHKLSKITAPPGVARTLTIIIRGKLLAAS